MARTKEEIEREKEFWDEFERAFFGEPVEERAAEIREWVEHERARRKRLAKENPE